MRIRILFLLVLLSFVLTACGQQQLSPDDVNIAIAVNPDPPAMGDATIAVSVTDNDGNPINDVSVKVTGDMSHEGMMPSIGESSEGTDGVYEVPFQWTMGGDWTLSVEVTLTSGEIASQEFEFMGVEGGMDDMGDMEHGDMDTGVSGVSGAYMMISNTTDADITLVSVSVAGVGMAQIHETTVENDIMRMEHMEDGLVIPAGESVELQPGSYHIMMMQLEADFVEGETVSVTLIFDNDASMTLEVPIVSTKPEDGLSVEGDGVTVSGAWARPTKLADTMDMDMEATEESGGD